MSDADLVNVSEYLAAAGRARRHPAFLLKAVLEILIEYSSEKRNVSETEPFHLESRLGVTRGKGSKGKGDSSELGEANAALARESTKDCNTLYTSLIYLERRLDFIIGYATSILEVVKQLRGSRLATLAAEAGRIVSQNLKFEKSPIFCA